MSECGKGKRAGGKACVKASRAESRPGFPVRQELVGIRSRWLVRLEASRGRGAPWRILGQGRAGSPGLTTFPREKDCTDGTDLEEDAEATEGSLGHVEWGNQRQMWTPPQIEQAVGAAGVGVW